LPLSRIPPRHPAELAFEPESCVAAYFGRFHEKIFHCLFCLPSHVPPTVGAFYRRCGRRTPRARLVRGIESGACAYRACPNPTRLQGSAAGPVFFKCVLALLDELLSLFYFPGRACLRVAVTLAHRGGNNERARIPSLPRRDSRGRVQKLYEACPTHRSGLPGK